METKIRETMRFLVIDKKVEDLIQTLERDVETLNSLQKEEFNEKRSILIKKTKDKLKLAQMYEKITVQRGEYEKIKHLKWKNPLQYIKKCRECVKDIKNIDFDTRSGLFRVRISRNRKQTYIGSFETPKDAADALNLYLKES